MAFASVEDRKAYAKAHYARNRQTYKSRARAYSPIARRKIRERIAAYLLEHPCVDCGEADPVVLEFDHVYGVKRESISKMANNGCAWETVESEIAKCEVRCANCHRRATHRRRLR